MIIGTSSYCTSTSVTLPSRSCPRRCWSGRQAAVAEITQVEAGARTERITRLRIRSSGLPCVKTLADSDWTFQPSVPRPLLEELSTLGFMERAKNVLLGGARASGRPTSRSPSGSRP